MDPEITNLNIYVYLDESHVDLILCWPSVIVTVVDSLQRDNAINFISLELLKKLTMET